MISRKDRSSLQAASQDEMWVGGWASGESANPYECHWFAERISHLEAPWFHMAGQSAGNFDRCRGFPGGTIHSCQLCLQRSY